ncbi:hypothetical protein ATE92_1425 [Ulvibacter sp. MAR_2010_11]|uniref:hypothetical protein n=1 Tax=Ulvibacter sp. MAR_2010_11 TaxID=1250229 RepID=UPI000C2CC308|nr:hypothetical protein [Ulvibacter sp. MAR_2010_11]PKA83275.1 hypothetical protein ATE92_1425 [Ulvibacter sp. MAR_2010_11]
MKKSSLILVLFSLVGGTILAQYNHTLNRATRALVENAERYSSATNYLPDDYTGSPYTNEAFLPGVIYENNEPIVTDYMLRFNALENEIEVKESADAADNAIKVLAKSPEIYVKIMNDLFVYNANESIEEQSGYFQVLVVGNKFNLYKKHYKKYYPRKEARNSFERDILASYKDRPIYFIVDQEGSFYEVSDSKNKRAELFDDKKTEINKFINHSKLDLSEESDFIKVFKYFDSFKDASL